MKLTLTEALCIIECGWSTEKEKELFDYAQKLIKHQCVKKHLEYQLETVNQKLKEYE